MPRYSPEVRLTLRLPASSEPLRRRIAEAIVDEIRRGILGDGDLLPSSRALAAELGVSRSSVIGAYDELTAAGFATGLGGVWYPSRGRCRRGGDLASWAGLRPRRVGAAGAHGRFDPVGPLARTARSSVDLGAGLAPIVACRGRRRHRWGRCGCRRASAAARRARDPSAPQPRHRGRPRRRRDLRQRRGGVAHPRARSIAREDGRVRGSRLLPCRCGAGNRPEPVCARSASTATGSNPDS